MSRDINVRWGWLKGMYIYTIAGAGAFGLGILIMPDVMCRIFGWPGQDQAIGFGVAGSVYTSFALLSVLGLRSPLKYSPVLLLQMCYKVVWFIGVAIYSIGLGPAISYGETILRYMATVGDDGDRVTTQCAAALPKQSCGQYYFAKTGEDLRPIFDNIASRIYTKITR